MRAKFKVGLVQMSMSADPQANLDKAAARVEEAARKGAEVICLPELYRSPYFCQKEDAALFDLAEAVPGPSTERLSEVARKAGVRGRRPDPSRSARRALPQQRGHPRRGREDGGPVREDAHPRRPRLLREVLLHAGDLGFQAIDTRSARSGRSSAGHKWYPEGARLTGAARRDGSSSTRPAIGWHPAEKAQHGAHQRDAWRTIQRGHAIANGCYRPA